MRLPRFPLFNNPCRLIQVVNDCFHGLLYVLEKPRDFDPFGQTGLFPLATI